MPIEAKDILVQPDGVKVGWNIMAILAPPLFDTDYIEDYSEGVKND